jgi:hypothetical protein
MSVLLSWLAWANVPFLSALGVAVLFALLQATGVLGMLAGGDHDGADHDADGADHDADGADGAEHDGEHGFSVTGLLGVGRVPLTFLLQAFAVSFGIAGLSINTLAYAPNAPPVIALLWALPTAFVVGFAVTAMVSRVAGKIFSTEGQEATGRGQLVGTSGVVISSRVDREFGEVRIEPRPGQTVRVVVTTRDEQPIVEGREVVVVEYDRERDRLIVAALESDADERAPPKSGAA